LNAPPPSNDLQADDAILQYLLNILENPNDPLDKVLSLIQSDKALN
jgi:hypothetical protein